MNFDLQTSARLALVVSVIFAIMSAVAGFLASKWNEEAQTLNEQVNTAFRASSTQALDQANRRALSAETELDALKRKLAPRELSQAVFDRLVELLRQAEANGPVRVGWSNNAESAAYGSRFAQALQAAGWTVEATIMLDLNGRGVFVVVQDQKTAPAHASPLLKALVDAGIDVKGLENEQFGRGALVSLLIAEKP